MRVRHLGHQYPEAYANGTGTVLAVMFKDPSSWSQTYGQPDVELLVLRDDGSISGVADYHVARLLAHQHESWQLIEHPDGGQYCQACGQRLAATEDV
jgi:hypothetical protein